METTLTYLAMYYPHALGMLAHDCLAECQVPQDGLSTPTVARLEELIRGMIIHWCTK